MLPYLALTLAMVLWASSFLVLKTVFAVFDPMVVLFARMVIASLCLAVIFARRRGGRWHYRAGDWKALLGMGLAEPCLYFLFEARALTLTTVSQAAVITATLPLLAALGARLFLREHGSNRAWFGIALSCSGIVWLTLAGGGGAGAANPALGNLLEFCAMICATGYVLLAKRLSPRYSPLALTAVQSVLGCVWFGAGLLLPGVALPTHLPLWPSLGVLYLGACITLGAYGLYTWSVSKVPVAQATAFINLIPVFTVTMAWSLLDERLSPTQGVACVLVFCGVFFVGHARAAPDDGTAVSPSPVP
ncbi:DMT family transporter [Paludibacterium yongneupense]|uniref:DMT family transporter n=1 Tax=Paludibacterium yongneupense TaxID=400061 RepID=UPI0003F72DAF|nr:DMT family transporter [Paludibacterium yongneupense]